VQSTHLAIEIGGTKLQLALGDASGAIHERVRADVDRSQGANGIRSRIEETVVPAMAAHSLRGVGVGFGGPVDWRTGQICCSHHVEGWADFPLAQWLRSLTHLPVSVDNDANVAALGEAVMGAGRGQDPVFYTTLGSGVGGGLVVGGRIYHGAIPGEAELGHVRLDRQGATVESRCSGWAVDRKIRALKARRPESLLHRLIGATEGGEARFIGAALEQGDPDARAILQETAEDLAFGLSHVSHLFHPATVVLGGGLALLGEPLRAAVAQALPGFLMEAFKPGPAVVLAELREDAVPVGALLLAAAAAAADR
jgi:glucokinase